MYSRGAKLNLIITLFLNLIKFVSLNFVQNDEFWSKFSRVSWRHLFFWNVCVWAVRGDCQNLSLRKRPGTRFWNRRQKLSFHVQNISRTIPEWGGGAAHRWSTDADVSDVLITLNKGSPSFLHPFDPNYRGNIPHAFAGYFASHWDDLWWKIFNRGA